MTSLTDGEWHRLHPASPLLRGGIFIVAVLGFIIANLRERLIDGFLGVRVHGGDPIDEIMRRGAAGWVLLGVAVVLVLILLGFYLSWRMHTFRVSDEVVEVRSGLVFRSNRRARLDRIQGVNIVRPFIPRLFGAAKLEVSVAGQDANVQLAYLGSAPADALRRDILHLASGLRQPDPPAPVVASGGTGFGAAVTGIAGGIGGFAANRASELFAPELDPDAAPPESVVRIPPGRLIGSVFFSGFTVVLVLGGIALIVGALIGGSGWLLVAILPGMIGSVSYYFSRFTKSLRYSIAGTPDGVRVGFGLLSTSNETLPPGRIHAIRVSQPLLWRPFGWWQVRINTAGHSTNKGAAGEANTTTLPVGTENDVARVLDLILPGFNSDDHLALISRGLRSKGGDDGFVNAPRRAAWLRPVSWRRTGYTISDGVALLRRGVVSRELILVPLARLQSVAVSQGPVQRMLRLASADLHTVAGPVAATLSVLDAGEAVNLFDRVAAGAVESAHLDTSHHWNLPSGIVPNGIAPSGIVPNGIAPSGIVPNGIVPDGIAPSRIVPNGAPE
ncbi:PH domain-containing protein [Cryobacterium sp. PH31-AA6]|uniref:PH domain-containing protein n=1 Tax=Cryobacterium sp. PH31-AA6 TaxID=3046205 RepID=UPI0024BBE5AB|nr:PH domain-containing protein [Cryobacterium sp. PH31-AA6]MDJ0323761.1 PH domain-containing protein [Cryobacterium sp. PH31-AA6]